MKYVIMNINELSPMLTVESSIFNDMSCTHGFCGVRVAHSSVFCVVFCRSLLVL